MIGQMGGFKLGGFGTRPYENHIGNHFVGAGSKPALNRFRRPGIMSSGVFNQNAGYHNRRSIRLPEYDYSQPGYYFVTICLHDRMKHSFGEQWTGLEPAPTKNRIGNHFVGAGSKPALHLTEHGKIVQHTWNDLPNHIDGIELDEFIIMPNHIHGIIRITGAGLKKRAGLEPAPTDTITVSEIVRQLKTFSARRINAQQNSVGQPVWQRNYYEHIIRDDTSLYYIRKYIRENPINWNVDSENHIDREIREFEMTEMGRRV